jgi:hypothetical protein
MKCIILVTVPEEEVEKVSDPEDADHDEAVKTVHAVAKNSSQSNSPRQL